MFLGQILVIPPYQRLGVGVQLLQSIYRMYVLDSRVKDITVEDPSENFVKLRDYVDCLNCMELDAFSPDGLRNGFTKEMAEEARSRLKLTKKQAWRVYEILRLKETDTSKPEELKKYRLSVKRRLNIPFQNRRAYMQKVQSALTDTEQAAALKVNLSVDERIDILDKGFNELYDQYKLILERLAQGQPKNWHPLALPMIDGLCAEEEINGDLEENGS